MRTFKNAMKRGLNYSHVFLKWTDHHNQSFDLRTQMQFNSSLFLMSLRRFLLRKWHCVKYHVKLLSQELFDDVVPEIAIYFQCLPFRELYSPMYLRVRNLTVMATGGIKTKEEDNNEGRRMSKRCDCQSNDKTWVIYEQENEVSVVLLTASLQVTNEEE